MNIFGEITGIGFDIIRRIVWLEGMFHRPRVIDMWRSELDCRVFPKEMFYHFEVLFGEVFLGSGLISNSVRIVKFLNVRTNVINI